MPSTTNQKRCTAPETTIKLSIDGQVQTLITSSTFQAEVKFSNSPIESQAKYTNSQKALPSESFTVSPRHTNLSVTLGVR